MNCSFCCVLRRIGGIRTLRLRLHTCTAVALLDAACRSGLPLRTPFTHTTHHYIRSHCSFTFSAARHTAISPPTPPPVFTTTASPRSTAHVASSCAGLALNTRAAHASRLLRSWALNPQRTGNALRGLPARIRRRVVWRSCCSKSSGILRRFGGGDAGVRVCARTLLALRWTVEHGQNRRTDRRTGHNSMAHFTLPALHTRTRTPLHAAHRARRICDTVARRINARLFARWTRYVGALRFIPCLPSAL